MESLSSPRSVVRGISPANLVGTDAFVSGHHEVICRILEEDRVQTHVRRSVEGSTFVKTCLKYSGWSRKNHGTPGELPPLR